jgi:secreted PhoX family phosphatase
MRTRHFASLRREFVGAQHARAVGKDWTVAPFLQVAGDAVAEVTGPVFSPDGSRVFVRSQRGADGDGMTFEITGPFASR